MNDRERVCQRAGCNQPASVTLSFRYDARQASLVDLTTEKHPAHYDLCGAHADLLSVPRGWERLDRRTPRPEPRRLPDIDGSWPPPQESQGGGFVPETVRHRRGLHGGAVAAETYARGTDETLRTAPRGDRYAALLADLPRLAKAWRVNDGDAPDDAGPGLYEPVTSDADDEEQELEGQLRMVIEPEPQGVVVALTRTRQS